MKNMERGEKMDFNFNWNYISDGAAYVTIGVYGLAFNSSCISLLGEPEQVILGFDINNMTIGIKKYQNEVGVKPYEFCSRIRQGWVRIGCKDFIKNLTMLSGISFASSKRYLAKFDKESNLLYITVNAVNEADNDSDCVEGDE